MELMGISLGFAAFWIIAAAILAIIEAFTMGLTTIWFTAGAVVAAISTLFGASIYIQIVLFLVVSIALLYFTRPLKNKLRIGKERTNADALIGKTGLVVEPITSSAYGQVKIGGQIWTAMAADSAVSIDAGREVSIAGIEGVKLIVLPLVPQEV